MANGDGQSRNITPQGQRAPSVLTLGLPTHLDISSLPQEVQDQLVKDHSRGVLDITKKAHELHVDVGALKAKLDEFARIAKEASKDGTAVTISNTKEDTTGRTEILIGNTEKARGGQFTKSQTGERDWNPYYIFAAIAAVVLIAFLFAGRH